VNDAKKINSLCHQLSAASALVLEQMERARSIEAEIARLMNVQPGGLNYHREDVEGFIVEAMRSMDRPAQVYITDRSATGAACKDN
jgi:hypothetical protein